MQFQDPKMSTSGALDTCFKQYRPSAHNLKQLMLHVQNQRQGQLSEVKISSITDVQLGIVVQ